MDWNEYPLPLFIALKPSTIRWVAKSAKAEPEIVIRNITTDIAAEKSLCCLIEVSSLIFGVVLD